MSTKIGEIVVNQQTAVILNIDGDHKIIDESSQAKDLLRIFEESSKAGPDGANWLVYALHELSKESGSFVPTVDILFGSGDTILEADQ